MSALGGYARPKGRRWLVSGLVLAVLSVMGVSPATQASAAGAAAENFTMTGGWTCTFGCSLTGVWGIAGNSTICQETEAEVEARIDVPPTLACHGANFYGNVNSACVAGVCVETGLVNFYLPDASDPGYTIGPIPVDLTGTALLVDVAAQGSGEQAYVLTATLETAASFPWPGALVWTAGGELEGGGCDGTIGRCAISQSFAATLTGVQVDS